MKLYSLFQGNKATICFYHLCLFQNNSTDSLRKKIKSLSSFTHPQVVSDLN